MGHANGIEAIPHMDASYKEKLRPYVVKYREYIDGLEKNNPYGVPIGLGKLGRQRRGGQLWHHHLLCQQTIP